MGPPPAFLWRTSTPESRARVDRVVREVLQNKRDWVMPGHNRGEGDMARLEAKIVNRDAPVSVYKYVAGGEPEHLRNFDNMAVFELWYNPSVHRLVPPPNSQKDYTDLLLEIKGDPKLPAIIRRETPSNVITGRVSHETAADAGIVEKPKKVVNIGNKDYIDMRHVRQMAEAGFNRVGDGHPMTYSNGKATATFPLPKEGSRWSSTWELNDGRAGKGIKALLEAVGVASR